MALRDENMPGTAVTKICVKWYRSAVFRFSVLNMMVILVLVGGVIFRGHQRDKQQLVKRFGSVLKTVSANGAVDIDGAKLAQINDNEDKGAAFVAARGVLERLRDVNGLANDAVYILRPSVDDPATYRFVVMLQDKTLLVTATSFPQRHSSFIRGSTQLMVKRWPYHYSKTTMARLSVELHRSKTMTDVMSLCCRRISGWLNMSPN